MIIPVDDEIAQVMARSHGNWSHTTAIRNSTNRLLALASEQQHKQTSDHSTTFEGEIIDSLKFLLHAFKHCPLKFFQ